MSDSKQAVSDARRTAVLGVLTDLEHELDAGFVEETFEVHGILWQMRSLCDHERTWANRYVQGNNVVALATSARAPTLAVGIRAIGKKIDGEKVMATVADFFAQQWTSSGADIDEMTRQALNSGNPHYKQYFFAEHLFKWLAHRPTEFVNALWQKWDSLEDRRLEAEKLMGKSSKGVGTSPPTTQTP